MIVTKDVIEDLIPVYLAGEASADTRTLVDEFVKAHPEMLDALQSADLPEAKAEPPRDLGLRALGETRKLISRRNAWLGWAVALGFGVLSFAIQGDRLVFLLLRDAPYSACALLAGSAVCLAMFYRSCRRLVVTGLGAPHSTWLWGSLATVVALPFLSVASAHLDSRLLQGLSLLPFFAGFAAARNLNRSGTGKR